MYYISKDTYNMLPDDLKKRAQEDTKSMLSEDEGEEEPASSFDEAYDRGEKRIGKDPHEMMEEDAQEEKGGKKSKGLAIVIGVGKPKK